MIVHRIINAANVLKTDFIAAMRMRQVAKKNENNIVRVGFIVQMYEIWDKEVDVYYEMKRRKGFETLLLVVPPYNRLEKNVSTNYENNYFLRKYKDAIKVVQNDGTIVDIAQLKLDYVFFQRPYNEYLPKKLQSNVLMNITKCCYIPYAYFGAYNFVDSFTNREFFRTISYAFFDSNEICREVKRKLAFTYCLAKQRFECIGYPVLDNYQVAKNCKKINNILWTPRWCFDESIISSCFMDYKDIILILAEKNPSVRFIFRPHPMLFEEVIRTQRMSSAEVEEYKATLQSKNIAYDKESLFSNVADISDLLITDFSSIIINYFLTGKPIIYCDSKAKLTREYEIIKRCSYVVHSSEELQFYVNELIQGRDTLREKRVQAIEKYFSLHKGAAKRIVDYLEDM